MTDAFGIVAMVAMTPLVTIQVMGLSSVVRHKLARRRLRSRMDRAVQPGYGDGNHNTRAAGVPPKLII